MAINSDDAIKGLAVKTFDVPLFGGLVTIRAERGSSQKLTGPVQFAIGRSVNKVQILNPMITGRFVGKEKKGDSQSEEKQEQFSTFGKFYAVDYALIKIQGAVNPANLGDYLEDVDVVESFKKAESKLFYMPLGGNQRLNYPIQVPTKKHIPFGGNL